MEELQDSAFDSLPVVSMERTGRFVRVVLAGREEEMQEALLKLSPAVLEQMPMDFEEMFIREVEGRGYYVNGGERK